jgi:hypothetical protein
VCQRDNARRAVSVTFVAVRNLVVAILLSLVGRIRRHRLALRREPDRRIARAPAIGWPAHVDAVTARQPARARSDRCT